MIDLRPHFKHLHWRVMPHSNGVEVASDFSDYPDDSQLGFYKNCGLWTLDEVQILHEVASAFKGNWLDIGSHTGWTTAHIAEPGNLVIGVDPMYGVEEFTARTIDNLEACEMGARVVLVNNPSKLFYPSCRDRFIGACIDGDHQPGEPLRDAQECLKIMPGNRVALLFHDASGLPVQEAVEWCAAQGMRVKVCLTPHIVVVCWRGDFHLAGYLENERVAKAVRPAVKRLERFI